MFPCSLYCLSFLLVVFSSFPASLVSSFILDFSTHVW